MTNSNGMFWVLRDTYETSACEIYPHQTDFKLEDLLADISYEDFEKATGITIAPGEMIPCRIAAVGAAVSIPPEILKAF